MFVGRENEIKMMRDRFDNDTFEMGVIYGQRRIGKTSLILEATKGYDHLYLLARNDGFSKNLSYFCGRFKEYFNLPFEPNFASFDGFFDALFDYAKDKKFILTIDEFPFLAKAYPGIDSYLQNKADEFKRTNKPIKLMLSGSDISFMEELLKDRSKPLYQRASFKIHVGPLLFSDAVKMLQNIDAVDKLKYLSIFGARPYYLEKIKTNKDFASNVIDLCFNASSILTDAPNMTLPIGYTSNSTYVAILLALALHKRKVKEIADALRIDDNACSAYLKRMLDGESIEKRETFRGNHKTNYYIIADPFMRFYYRLIYPNLAEIDRGLGQSVFSANEAVIEDIVDRGFEDVVNAYMDERNSKGLLHGVYRSFKNYATSNSSLGRPIEVDGLAESIDGTRLVAIEDKFRNKSLSLEVFEHLKESVSIFAKDYEEVDYYLFSKSGFSNDLLALDDPHIHRVSLQDMME